MTRFPSIKIVVFFLWLLFNAYGIFIAVGGKWWQYVWDSTGVVVLEHEGPGARLAGLFVLVVTNICYGRSVLRLERSGDELQSGDSRSFQVSEEADDGQVAATVEPNRDDDSSTARRK